MQKNYSLDKLRLYEYATQVKESFANCVAQVMSASTSRNHCEGSNLKGF